MKYDNVFSVSDSPERTGEFLYSVYAAYVEKKDEDVKNDIIKRVSEIWKKNEKVHLTVSALVLSTNDDILKSVYLLFYPKEEKEREYNHYLGFLCDESETETLELSDFQNEVLKFYLILMDEKN